MILTVTLNAAIDKRYVVETVRLGEVNRVRECVYTPGGKGLNVSKPAAIAGAQVVATGFAGGHAGAYIEAALTPLGIRPAFYHLKAESRTCINIWDKHNRLQTEFLEPGFEVTAADFEGFMVRFEELAGSAEVVVMSGSAPKGLPENVYQTLVETVKNKGKAVILDTSGAYLKAGIMAGPTMIKPNLDEIRMLTGKTCERFEDMVAAAREIYQNGVSLVVVSLGSEGAFVVCGSGTYRAKVPRIDAVNTVGCGDAMTAGFALGLGGRLAVPEMLRQASAISAAAALREETGYYRPEDMLRLLPQIEIVRLEN